MNKLKKNLFAKDAYGTVFSVFIISCISLILLLISSTFGFVSDKHKNQSSLDLLAIEYATQNVIGEDFICGKGLIAEKLNVENLKCETSGEDVKIEHIFYYKFFWNFYVSYQIYAKAGPKNMY